jgi:hypothetical protein
MTEAAKGDLRICWKLDGCEVELGEPQKGEEHREHRRPESASNELTTRRTKDYELVEAAGRIREKR